MEMGRGLGKVYASRAFRGKHGKDYAKIGIDLSNRSRMEN
jgi:hypothetical protein